MTEQTCTQHGAIVQTRPDGVWICVSCNEPFTGQVRWPSGEIVEQREGPASTVASTEQACVNHGRNAHPGPDGRMICTDYGKPTSSPRPVAASLGGGSLRAPMTASWPFSRRCSGVLKSRPAIYA